MKRIVLSEEEKDDLSKKHEEIDRKLMNFLLRRYQIEEKTLPIGIWSDEDDMPSLSWKEVHFVDFPGYNLSSYMSRKDMEWRILNMLEDAEKLNVDDFRGNKGFDADRQKKMKTIRAFLNFVLPVK
jgi:seryl-tRNA synthetase